MKQYLLLAVVFLLFNSTHAATRQWTNTLGGNWFTAGNWSPNSVPGVLDTANINVAGTYTITIATGTVSIASLNLGAVSGTQTLLVGSGNPLSVTNNGIVSANGVLNLTDGGLIGRIVIQPSGQLQFSGSANKSVYNLSIVNQGTIAWSGGQLLGGSSGSTTISNGGLWQITGDNQINQTYGGPMMTLTNAGTIQKTAGSGTSHISDFQFVNRPSGTVQVTSGTLQFNGGSSSQLGGQFIATAPGLISINSGTWFDSGGAASGTGTSRFHGGTLNLRTNIIPNLMHTGGDIYVVANTFQQAGAITNLTLDGSQLRGTNTVGSGTLLVRSGGLDGRLTVGPLGTLQFTTSANKNVYNLDLINQGTINWEAGQLLGGSSSSTTVSNGGVWQITGDNQIYQTYGGPMMTFTNAGTIQKSGGSGITHLSDFQFVNRPSGTVQVTSGTLQFNGGSGSQLGGQFIATAPGLMSINSGTWFDSGGMASGTGTSRFHGGTLNLRTNIIPNLMHTGGDIYVVANTFQEAGAITNLTLDGSQLRGTNGVGNGTLLVRSGGLDGRLTVGHLGTLQFTTSANKNVYNLNLINQGAISWAAGQLLGGSSSSTTVSNGGLWEMTGDNQIHQTYGGPTMNWTNTGTIRKSGGSGVSHISDFVFVNRPGGIVEALSGTLQFNSAASPASQIGGSFNAVSPAIVSLAAGTWTDAGGAAAGTGTVRFHGGTLNLRTNITPGLQHTGGDIYVIASTFQQAGAITNLALDGSQLHGTNRVGAGMLTVRSGGVDGQLTVEPPGTLQFTNAANKNVYNLTLLNQGTVAWYAGQLLGGSASSTTVSNGGLWQMFGDSQIYQTYGGPALNWLNTGTIQKSGGAGTSQISDFNFVNAPGGLVQALSGTIQFNGGTASQIGGTFSATTPAIVSIASGTWFDSGGTAIGTGVSRFHGGTLNLRTNIIPNLLHTGGDIYVIANTFQQAGAITNLTIDGSQLRGTNTVGTGTLTINSGGADGVLTIGPAGTLHYNTTANKNVYNLRLINQGTVAWNAGQLLGGSSASTTVSNGGLWQMTGDNQIYQTYGGPAMNWTNTGTILKSGGTGISHISDFRLLNASSGVIRSDIGTIQLPNNFTNTAGTLRLNGGTLQSSGPLYMNGGTLEGAGAVGQNGISGGTITPGQSGPGSIGFKSGLNLSAGAIVSLAGTGTTPGTQYDQLSVTGAVALANATLQVLSLPSVPVGTTFVLIQNDGADAVSGTFDSLPENAAINVSGQQFRIHYAGGTGNDVTLVRDSGVGATGAQLASGGYSNGVFRVRGVGGSSVIYAIQATTNFVQWTNIGNATGDLSGNFIFQDTNAFRFQYRFYRTTN